MRWIFIFRRSCMKYLICFKENPSRRRRKLLSNRIIVALLCFKKKEKLVKYLHWLRGCLSVGMGIEIWFWRASQDISQFFYICLKKRNQEKSFESPEQYSKQHFSFLSVFDLPRGLTCTDFTRIATRMSLLVFFFFTVKQMHDSLEVAQRTTGQFIYIVWSASLET